MQPTSANTQPLDHQISDVNNVSLLLAHYLKKDEEGAVKLLKVYGVSISPLSSSRQIRFAFLKAIKENEQFRMDVAKILASRVPSKGQKPAHQFVNQPAASADFINQPAFQNLFGAEDVGGTTTSTGTTSSTGTSSGGGGFWDTLGNIFSKEVIQKGINTGLDALSAKMQADANKTTEQNALALEEERLKQLQTQLEIEKARANKPPGSSMPTWAKWAIGGGVGLIVIIGVVALTRRKKAA